MTRVVTGIDAGHRRAPAATARLPLRRVHAATRRRADSWANESDAPCTMVTALLGAERRA
jgi:hypothetical protein